jgi:hypothetical protein
VFLYGSPKQVTTRFQNYMLFDRLPDQYDKVSGTAGDDSDSALATNPSLDDRGLTPRANLDQVEWREDLTAFPRVGDGRVEIRRMAFVLQDSLKSVGTVQGHEAVILLLDIFVNAPVDAPQIGWVLYNRLGAIALHTNNDICQKPLGPLSRGQRLIAQFCFRLPGLTNGNYIFSIGLQCHGAMPQKIDDVYEFNVARSDVKGTQCGYVVIEEESFDVAFID